MKTLRRCIQLLFLVSLFLIADANAVAQTLPQRRNPSLGLHYLAGNFAPALFDFSKRTDGYAITYNDGIRPKLDYSIRLGSITGEKPANQTTRVERGLLHFLAAHAEQRLLPPNTFAKPFLTVGAGATLFEKRFAVSASTGIGVSLQLTKQIQLDTRLVRQMHSTNKVPDFTMASLGLTGVIKERKPRKSKPRAGISTVIDTRTLNYDQDNDGTPDSLDACPTIPGPAIYKGCPDSDGDGIPDHLDKCPTVPGTARLQGCPDTSLAPPDKHEAHENSSNRDSILATIQRLSARIHFELNKATLTKEAAEVLQEIAATLNASPIESVTIIGHTDNSGNAGTNLELSHKRAEAVKAFLTMKGVAQELIKTNGMGSTRPISSNQTADGRAANRRTEFIIKFR